jgi:hypothetical protein
VLTDLNVSPATSEWVGTTQVYDPRIGYGFSVCKTGLQPFQWNAVTGGPFQTLLQLTPTSSPLPGRAYSDVTVDIPFVIEMGNTNPPLPDSVELRLTLYKNNRSVGTYDEVLDISGETLAAFAGSLGITTGIAEFGISSLGSGDHLSLAASYNFQSTNLPAQILLFVGINSPTDAFSISNPQIPLSTVVSPATLTYNIPRTRSRTS